MKRASRFASLVLPAALVAMFVPQAGAMPAAVQLNVRHLANVPGTTGGHVVTEGNRLYMGNYGIGMSIYDITNPAKPVQLGTYRPGRAVADAVPDAAHYPERSIAVLGGTNRAPGTATTDWLDVTNPASPQLLYSWTSAADGESHNTDLVDERKLYLPSGGRSGDMMRIYDISPLLNTPPAAPTRIASGNLNTLWLNSPYRAKLGRTTGPQPTHVHDLEVYTDHRVLLLPDEWVDQDGDGVADPTYANKDIALFAASQDYPLTVGAGTGVPSSAVFIVDITDPRNPVAMNKIQARPGHRYLHEVKLLEGDKSIMYTSDEDLHNGCDAGGVYSWRLSEDLTGFTYLDTWYNGAGTPAPVCSAHVFDSAGDYVFMGSYNAGLQVIDFTDPANLVRAGQYIAEGANAWGATYHNGYVYTGDFGARGLDVYQFLANPAKSAIVKAGNPASAQVQSISETVGACDPASPADAVDGFAVPIPADKRGPGHVFRAVGTSEAGEYDVDVWFYDQGCNAIADGNLTTDAGIPGVATLKPDEQGPIPSNAAFGYVVLARGATQLVYAQIDPPF